MRLQFGEDDLFLDPLLDPTVWSKALPGTLAPLPARGAGNRYAVVTHRHPDHFDPLAIERVLGERGGVLLCTADVAPAAARAGFQVRLAALYEPVPLGPFTATAVPASDGQGDPQVSWVVRAGDRRILHGGDTMWHGAWWRIGRQQGPFDAAFLPINGARFGWLDSRIANVLTPEQAVEAAVALGARMLVPIHYGIVGGDNYEEVDDPSGAVQSAARARGLRVQVAAPGAWIDWDSAG